MLAESALDFVREFGIGVLATIIVAGFGIGFAWLATDDDLALRGDDGPVEID